MNDSPRFLIAGNWKMHGSVVFATALAGTVARYLEQEGDYGCDVLICPPAPLLAAARAAAGTSTLRLGGQDCHPETEGPYTGEVSAAMLAALDCSYVIVGHSERRTHYGEDNTLVRAKAVAALAQGLVPIICVGETRAEREAGRAIDIVSKQLATAVPDRATAQSVVIAYEPVWAIGTGLTPGPDEIAEMHAIIRGVLANEHPDARSIRILYGGSVKPDNAETVLGISDVGGVLVGGASLDATGFWRIVRSGGNRRPEP